MIEIAKTSRIISGIQYTLFFLATALYIFNDSDGLNGLGYQLILGFFLVMLVIANTTLLAYNWFKHRANKNKPDHIALILYLIFFVLVFACGPLIEKLA